MRYTRAMFVTEWKIAFPIPIPCPASFSTFRNHLYSTVPFLSRTVPDSIMEDRERKMSNVTPKLMLVRSPVLSRTNTAMTEPLGSDELSSNKQDISRIDTDLLAILPAFERHQESTAIELFYDLFFVANLTTFSNIHEITDVKTLTSYIGFFSILWFNWCLTSMYDIRFVSDSLLARIAKGVHLGVMVGLAFSGPNFDTEHNAQLRVMGITPILPMPRLNN